MQPEFRLLDAYQRWRIGVAKDGQQAEIAQRAVGQAGRRNGDPAFVQEDLDRATLDLNVVILDVVVQCLECRKHTCLDRRVTPQSVEYQAEIACVRLQGVIPQIGLLRQSRRGIAAKAPLAIELNLCKL